MELRAEFIKPAFPLHRFVVLQSCYYFRYFILCCEEYVIYYIQVHGIHLERLIKTAKRLRQNRQ
jgi:hypothetical protein